MAAARRKTKADPTGFWVPNELVDRHRDALKARGVFLYCCLARCPSTRCYPSAAELARQTGMSGPAVEHHLNLLRAVGLLNAHDLAAIRAADERSGKGNSKDRGKAEGREGGREGSRG